MFLFLFRGGFSPGTRTTPPTTARSGGWVSSGPPRDATLFGQLLSHRPRLPARVAAEPRASAECGSGPSHPCRLSRPPPARVLPSFASLPRLHPRAPAAEAESTSRRVGPGADRRRGRGDARLGPGQWRRGRGVGAPVSLPWTFIWEADRRQARRGWRRGPRRRSPRRRGPTSLRGRLRPSSLAARRGPDPGLPSPRVPPRRRRSGVSDGGEQGVVGSWLLVGAGPEGRGGGGPETSEGRGCAEGPASRPPVAAGGRDPGAGRRAGRRRRLGWALRRGHSTVEGRSPGDGWRAPTPPPRPQGRRRARSRRPAHPALR